MMAKSNLESSRGPSPRKAISPKQQGGQTPQKTGTPKSRGNSPPGLRTSPGLVAGHYAGCKFTEPPLPSALPLPPQHWMQTNATVTVMMHPFEYPKHESNQLAQHLKLLLKVEA